MIRKFQNIAITFSQSNVTCTENRIVAITLSQLVCIDGMNRAHENEMEANLYAAGERQKRYTHLLMRYVLMLIQEDVVLTHLNIQDTTNNMTMTLGALLGGCFGSPAVYLLCVSTE